MMQVCERWIKERGPAKGLVPPETLQWNENNELRVSSRFLSERYFTDEQLIVCFRVNDEEVCLKLRGDMTKLSASQFKVVRLFHDYHHDEALDHTSSDEIIFGMQGVERDDVLVERDLIRFLDYSVDELNDNIRHFLTSWWGDYLVHPARNEYHFCFWHETNGLYPRMQETREIPVISVDEDARTAKMALQDNALDVSVKGFNEKMPSIQKEFSIRLPYVSIQCM